MNGNFTRANRRHSGHALDVEGWLVWEDGDTEATLTITITQGSVTATAAPVTVTPDDDTWRVEVNANGSEFVQGVAAGLAGATGQTSGTSSVQSWISGPLQVH